MNPTDPHLFDPAENTPQTCAAGHCQAIRLPGQHGPIITCAHDLDPEHRRRPRGCLNAYDPATAEIPY